MPTESLFRPISAATEPFIDVEFDGRSLAVPGRDGAAMHERGVSPAEVGHYRIRPPIKPVTLEELAAL